MSINESQLPGGNILTQNETVKRSVLLSLSIALFFRKTNIVLTNKRLITESPNLFWIFPVGKNVSTTPLNKISSITISNNFSIKGIIFGAILTMTGLSNIKAILLAILGIITILNSIRAAVVIRNSGGEVSTHFISPFDKSTASQFINEVNTTVAEIA